MKNLMSMFDYSLFTFRTGNSSDGGSSSRVVNQLLTEMDGVQVKKINFLKYFNIPYKLTSKDCFRGLKSF